MEIVNGERLVLGTCYYPEHWDESLWRDDLRRMLENGIEVIRIAEFAWSKIEGYESNLLYSDSDTAGMADRKISGSSECDHGWCSVPPWRKKTLQLQFPEISGADQNHCGKIRISLCKTSGNHRMADRQRDQLREK